MNTNRKSPEVTPRGQLPCHKGLATERAGPIFSSMADGYIIEVTNPFVSAGEPVKQIWFAHIHDKARAIKAVRKAAGAAKHVSVDVVRAERHVILLERLGVLEGEVRPS